MRRTPKWTVPALLSLLCVPWSVQVIADREATYVFAWGLFDPDPLQVTTIWDFLFVHTAGLPDYIYAWPLSVAVYLLAVAVAVVGPAVGSEDGRLVAGLLAVAGVAQLSLARGFSVQPGRTAWPVGTLALFAAAVYVYALGRDAGERDADVDADADADD